MNIKRKICDISAWRKYLFLDIYSANIDKHVPAIYQCVETSNIEVFSLFSQPFPHFRFNFFIMSETFATQL
jgi:hypothetical protein